MLCSFSEWYWLILLIFTFLLVNKFSRLWVYIHAYIYFLTFWDCHWDKPFVFSVSFLPSKSLSRSISHSLCALGCIWCFCVSDVSLLSACFHASFCCSPWVPLPLFCTLTCTCAFSICSITSVQYFSFSPVSFVFLLPASSHPLVSSLLLPWGSAVSGSFSAAKKKKLQAALDLVVLLISHYSLRRQSKKHNCIYIYQHF